MQVVTRETLLRLTPDRYLAGGYHDASGTRRPGLLNTCATAAAEQLLLGGLAPQEMSMLIESIRLLLPMCKGEPRQRAEGAVTRAHGIVNRVIGQPNNPALTRWAGACAAAVRTTADFDAFLDHMVAAQRQYAVIVSLRPE